MMRSGKKKGGGLERRRRVDRGIYIQTGLEVRWHRETALMSNGVHNGAF
jgi:hypothetical protein